MKILMVPRRQFPASHVPNRACMHETTQLEAPPCLEKATSIKRVYQKLQKQDSFKWDLERKLQPAKTQIQ